MKSLVRSNYSIQLLTGVRARTNNFSPMPFHGWGNIDQAHLLQKIILLQLLNRTPKEPSEVNLLEWKTRGHEFPGRILDLQREKELAESFAFLAATTNDPKKVVAACLEEAGDQACLTVRLAMNSGNLNHVVAGFERMAKIFERFARAGELYATVIISISKLEYTRAKQHRTRAPRALI